MSKRVAFWDVDGTLVAESMERHFLKFLLDFHHTTEARISWNLLRLLIGRLPHPKWYQMKLAYLRGMKLSDVESQIAECWEQVIRHHLQTDAVAEFNRLKDQHYRQVLLSGTPVQLAQPLADHLGADAIIAAIPEVREGRLTGAVVAPHPHGRLKAAYAEKWCRENGFDLWQATAYGDHWGDRFILESVATAIVVHPAPKLADLAKRKGWRIIQTTM